MTLPDIDSMDYATNDDYSDQPEEPKEFWVVYYQGLTGKWYICLPSLYEENAINLTNQLDRPTKILHYRLESSNDHIKKVKKVRKVRKVKQPV